MRTTRACAVLIVAASALLPSTSSAEPRDTNQRALKLAYEADDLYARGQWAAAYGRFAEADALAHSPVFVLYMARCRLNAERLVEAETIFARVAHESISSDTPKPIRDAVLSAAREREDVIRRIPHARAIVERTTTAPTRLLVDGKEVTDPSAAIPLDPGAHTIDASSGQSTAHRDVIVRDGEGEVRIVLALAATSSAASEGEATRGSLGPALIAASVGLVGLGIGTVTGLIAVNRASGVKAGCVDGHCPVTSATDLDDARTMARISTIAFIAAGAGLATAGVLFVVRLSARGPRATATITPTSIGVGATF